MSFDWRAGSENEGAEAYVIHPSSIAAFLSVVDASLIATSAHCDAVRRGYPSHQRRPNPIFIDLLRLARYSTQVARSDQKSNRATIAAKE